MMFGVPKSVVLKIFTHTIGWTIAMVFFSYTPLIVTLVTKSSFFSEYVRLFAQLATLVVSVGVFCFLLADNMTRMSLKYLRIVIGIFIAALLWIIIMFAHAYAIKNPNEITLVDILKCEKTGFVFCGGYFLLLCMAKLVIVWGHVKQREAHSKQIETKDIPLVPDLLQSKGN